MTEWKTIHIGELGTVITGKTPKTACKENYGGEIPFLTPSDELTTKFVLMTKKTLSKLGLAEVKKCLLPANSICVSCIGSDLGKVVKTICPVVTNQQFNSIIPNDDYDADFVYYLMCIVGQELNYLSKTSTAVPIINKSQFENHQIKVTSLPEQKRIAGILSVLDDKIELNRRINANLEAQAMALYKQWFVDGRQEDWAEKKLGDIVDIYDSLRKPLSGQQREKMAKIYPYYGAASLMDYVENYIFDGIYLLLGEDGTVSDENGYPSLQYVWGKFWVNNHAHVLTGKNGYSTEMLYILLKQTNIHSIITGAVQPKINQANLLNLPVVCPPKDILNKYNEIIQPLFTQLRNNSEQVKHLSALRDALLPKLMGNQCL